ncbi:MAG TPA: acyl-CoA dehydrogenase family protein [Burkholderiaceae bacterium]|nr:acyl-CoA dehydrogenase family protein [Burkholderiaceae bacterium]
MALDFTFSPEHEAWRTHVREFAERELHPHSREWDEQGDLPYDALRRMGEAGILGVIGARRLGGQERDYLSLGIAIEEIAAADISCALIAWQQATHSHFFPGWGDDTVRAVHAGESVIAFATSEEDAGSDLSAIQTRAVRDGEDYVLNGQKVHVSMMPGADVLAVSCKIASDEPSESKKMALLRVPSNLPGVSSSLMEQMGARAHRLGIVNFDNVRVPATATLGEEGQGKALMYARFNVSRCLSPLAALGAAQAALKETMQFAKERIAFGRPIATNQSISFPLVEHHAKIEAARLLAYRALVANDKGLDATKDAAMAKWFGITTGIETIQDCLQMYGANGYLKDNAIEQRLRDVYSFLFTGGTLNIMKLILVRQLLGAEFAGLRT